MTSKTSFPKRCSEFAKIYLWSLKRNAGMGGILAALMFVGIPVVLLLDSGGNRDSAPGNTLSYLSFALPIASLILLLFTVLLCVRMFGFLQNRHSVDLFHALPVGRVPMLLGNWCAGMTLLAVPVAFSFAAVLAITASRGYAAEIGAYLLLCFFRLILSAAAALSCTAFFMTCSGSTMDALLSMLCVNLCWKTAAYCAMFFASHTIPGMQPIARYPRLNGTSAAVLLLITPFEEAYLPFVDSSTREILLPGWFLPWWIFFTAAMLAGACFFYARRKSEAAGDHFAGRVPKILVRFLAAVGAGLALSLFGLGEGGKGRFGPSVFVALTISLFAHTAAEVIFERGFRTLKRSLRGYAVSAACLAAFFGIIATGCFGYGTYVPQDSKVESVTFDWNSGVIVSQDICVKTEDGIKKTVSLPRILEQPEDIEAVVQIHKKLAAECRKQYYPCALNNFETRSFTITYRLRGGRTVSRSFAKTGDSEYDDEWKEAQLSIVKLSGFQKTGSILHYLGPDSIDIVWPNDGSAQAYQISDESMRSRLLAALLAEDSGQDGKCQADGQKTGMWIHYNSFCPNDTLRKAIGENVTQVVDGGWYCIYRQGGEVDQVLQEIAATEK